MKKLNTWTITAELTVFAGDMSEENVIQNAEELLESITDGSDITKFYVIKANRDEM